MSLIVKNSKKDFQPAPEGLQRAVCCDVVDLGVVETKFGRKRMYQIRWQSEELQEDGKPYLILQRYAPSLHKKSNLRRDLESWRGKPFTEAETEQLDLETLLGKNCQINIVHNRSDDGTTYANVKAIVPAAKGAPLLKVRDYERVSERDGYVPPAADPEDSDSYEPPHVIPAEDEEEVPF